MPLSSGGAVKGVLAVVCNECGTVCGFHDSCLPAVQAAVQRYTPNAEIRAALSESEDIDQLERVDSIKGLFK
ncbi:MAG: hypothetical protein V7731_02620 [Amphritea sp.]